MEGGHSGGDLVLVELQVLAPDASDDLALALRGNPGERQTGLKGEACSGQASDQLRIEPLSYPAVRFEDIG